MAAFRCIPIPTTTPSVSAGPDCLLSRVERIASA